MKMYAIFNRQRISFLEGQRERHVCRLFLSRSIVYTILIECQLTKLVDLIVSMARAPPTRFLYFFQLNILHQSPDVLSLIRHYFHLLLSWRNFKLSEFFHSLFSMNLLAVQTCLSGYFKNVATPGKPLKSALSRVLFLWVKRLTYSI